MTLLRASGAPVVLALVSAALFGAATPMSKILLGDIPPFQLAGLLYLGAALAMLPVVVGQPRHARLDARNVRRLAGAVLFGGLVAPVILLFGLRAAPAGSVSLLLNLETAATAILGALCFAEPLAYRGWAGIAGIALAGALLSGGAWPGIAATLLVATACVCWGLDNHLTALIDGMTPAYSTLCKGAVAGSVNLLIGLVAGPVRAAGWDVAAALAVGALSYGVSIALYIRAAQHLGAVRAQAVFASAPFLGAALSYAVLGEAITLSALTAAALMAAAVWLLLGGAHAHSHRHGAVEHVHSHRHDDGHHLHGHPDLPADATHVHRHRHDELAHAHPHWPDLHHRHEH
jgi:drug/metabolite transporter (DMT)-like permease